MKRFITLLLLTLTMASVNAMNYESARREALFMTDKMTLELGLNVLQTEAVYEINLDYLLALNGAGGYYGSAWKRRNNDLQYVLTVAQYNRYLSTTYFYRPVVWRTNHIAFTIYDRYTHADMYYYVNPTGYDTYRGRTSNDRYYYRGRNYSTPNTPPRTDLGKYGHTTKTTNHGTWRENTTTKPNHNNTTKPNHNNTTKPKDKNNKNNNDTWRNNKTNTKTKPSSNNNNTHFGGKR